MGANELGAIRSLSQLDKNDGATIRAVLFEPLADLDVFPMEARFWSGRHSDSLVGSANGAILRTIKELGSED